MGTKRKAVTIIFSDRTISNNRCLYSIPMTPQANLPPALPVFRLSSVPPFPRSSVLLCTTRARPMMQCRPLSEIRSTVKVKLATPLASASMLPRSPTWRFFSFRSPCSFCEETKAWRFHNPRIVGSENKAVEQGHMSVTLQAVWIIKLYITTRVILRVTFRVSFAYSCTMNGCDSSVVHALPNTHPPHTHTVTNVLVQSSYYQFFNRYA